LADVANIPLPDSDLEDETYGSELSADYLLDSVAFIELDLTGIGSSESVATLSEERIPFIDEDGESMTSSLIDRRSYSLGSLQSICSTPTAPEDLSPPDPPMDQTVDQLLSAVASMDCTLKGLTDRVDQETAEINDAEDVLLRELADFIKAEKGINKEDKIWEVNN
jgi:hypothetical protein